MVERAWPERRFGIRCFYDRTPRRGVNRGARCGRWYSGALCCRCGCQCMKTFSHALKRVVALVIAMPAAAGWASGQHRHGAADADELPRAFAAKEMGRSAAGARSYGSPVTSVFEEAKGALPAFDAKRSAAARRARPASRTSSAQPSAVSGSRRKTGPCSACAIRATTGAGDGRAGRCRLACRAGRTSRSRSRCRASRARAARTIRSGAARGSERRAARMWRAERRIAVAPFVGLRAARRRREALTCTHARAVGRPCAIICA
ncbi:Uncharacterised protein [Burkholderia pseudomallei]|nr:Uncharacterised protein [Burkholderia pseudomallei]